jgi:hypothetical protein
MIKVFAECEKCGRVDKRGPERGTVAYDILAWRESGWRIPFGVGSDGQVVRGQGPVLCPACRVSGPLKTRMTECQGS